MIDTNLEKIGKDYFHIFTIINEAFNGENGWVELTCRVSDMKSEGEHVFIDVTDSKVCKNGSFAPITLDKSDLEQFIKFLTHCHSKFK